MNKQPMKIMVVDDEIHILHVVALKLRKAGFDVITLQDGKEAYEQAQVELPDLIITDYQMPHLTGLELCQRLRQIPTTKHIPAIMLTARGFSLDRSAMLAAGVEVFMTKPFGPRDLLQKVESILNLSMV